MPQLPPIPGAVWGVSPTSKTDGAGVLFLSCFVGKSQRVYKLVAGAWVAVSLEADPTARGVLDVDTDGRCYLTAWDDRAAALWRIPVPGWVPTRGPAGPQGVPGPQGPAGEGAALTPDERRGLDWLMGWLGALMAR